MKQYWTPASLFVLDETPLYNKVHGSPNSTAITPDRFCKVKCDCPGLSTAAAAPPQMLGKHGCGLPLSIQEARFFYTATATGQVRWHAGPVHGRREAVLRGDG